MNKVIFIAVSLLLFIGCISNKEVKGKKEESEDKKTSALPPVEVMAIPVKKEINQIKIDIDEESAKRNDKKKTVNKEKTEKTSWRERIKSEDNNKRQTNKKAVTVDYGDISIKNVENLKIKELNLKELDVEVDKNLYISLKDPGWIIHKIEPDLIKMLKRDNFEKNTLFKLIGKTPAKVNILFIRYDENQNILIRQPYRINIISKRYKEYNKAVENKNNNIIKNETNKGTQKIENTEIEDDQDKITADRLFENGEYSEAKKYYEKLINDGKINSDISYKLGIIEKEFNNIPKAIEYFRYVINDKEYPNYYDAVYELLLLLKEQKKYNEAISILNRYELLKDKNNIKIEELNLLLADLYFDLKDYKTASDEYRNFIQIFPYSDLYDKALFYLAYSLESRRINPEYKEAYRIYNIIIDERPESDFYNLSKKRILYLRRHFLNIH